MRSSEGQARGTKRGTKRANRASTLSEINGLHGGRGKLGRPSRAEIEREAQRIATEAAGLSGWRVPESAPPAAREAADWALQRIRDVAEGRVSFRLAASTLKAAITIREEICGSIETKSKISGGIDWGVIVAEAEKRNGFNQPNETFGALPPAPER